MATKKSSKSSITKTAGKQNGIKTSPTVAKKAAKVLDNPKASKTNKSIAASAEENAKKTTSRAKVSKKASTKK